MRAQIDDYFRPPYTLETLQKAEALFDRSEVGSANNPDSGLSTHERLRDQCRDIREWLKAAGVIPYSDAELLQQAIDRLHPDARSRSKVTYQGKVYQITYWPAQVSRSGKTVHEWAHEWTEVKP